MNLLHLSQIFNYGSAEGILALIKGLDSKLRSQSILLSQERSWMKHSPGLLEQLFRLGIQYRMVESTFYRNPWALQAIRKYLRSYAHGPQNLLLTHGGFGALAASKEGIPFVHMCHGLGMGRPAWIDEQDLLGISSARRVIAVSNDIAGQLVRLGVPRDRIRTAYYPLEPVQRIYPRTIPIREVAMIGNLVPLKGQIHGIDAFHWAVEQEPSLRLNIFGEGPLRHELELKVKRLGLQTRGNFHGFRNMRKEYPYIDLVMVPSLVEGLGMVILEAFEYGIPVCAFRTGGIPEIIEDGITGYLSQRGSAEELGRSLLRAVQDSDRSRQMALRGLCKVQGMFDQGKNLKIVLSGLEEVLGDDIHIEIGG